MYLPNRDNFFIKHTLSTKLNSQNEVCCNFEAEKYDLVMDNVHAQNIEEELNFLPTNKFKRKAIVKC